ncbi:hypothetical protein [Desertivirga arenae]|uniref:hypothetical protein n=1 Tax=Desertivirga arenae TaxID=2810309 RepID=UPI001A977D72|nr:hypothetical protein [Pedobacter sp. SYSU D00823]
MENNSINQEKLKNMEHVEHDYEHHQRNPGPSHEAVHQENDEGAGPALKWIIPPLVLVLIITWLLFML